MLQRDKLVLPSGKHTTNPKKVVKHSVGSTPNQNQLTRIKTNIKQQNLPSPKLASPKDSLSDFAGDTDIVEVMTKRVRQKGRSTVTEREPWGQLLKQHKSSEKVSVFSTFDPLRTLHFLAKELQHQIQAVLPDDNSVNQMVTDMQYALKRVPPEVASMIHLQQAIDMLPKKSKDLEDDTSDRVRRITSEKSIQTDPLRETEEARKLQMVMEDSTMKLEISCRQMEALCEQLKNEKMSLQTQLEVERDSAEFLKKKIEELKFENTEILAAQIKTLEEQRRNLQSELTNYVLKMETNTAASTSELRSTLSEVKAAKMSLEQECSKLKHQLRLAAIEKEKFMAVLAVRDRQIKEIRSEMTQLQEVVNEQLMEFHNNALGSIPSNNNIGVNPTSAWNAEQNKENVGDIGDTTLSTINSNNDPHQEFIVNRATVFKDLPCGDVSENVLLNDGYPIKDERCLHATERHESQATIRQMFNELKQTAYELSNAAQNQS